MAGAVVQSAYTVDDSGSSSTTISATLLGVTAGNTLVAHAGWDSVSNPTCSTSDGSAYTSTAASIKDTGNNQSGQVFYLPNVGAGTHTITATFSASIDFRRFRVYEISGVTAAPLDKTTGQFQASPGTGSDAVSSGATAATANTCFLLGLSQAPSELDPGSGTVTAGTSPTAYTIVGSNIIMSAESAASVAAGAQTATFTQSTANTRITHILALIETSAVPLIGSFNVLKLPPGRKPGYQPPPSIFKAGAASRAYLLTAQAGSYTYAGQSANLIKGRVMVASTGTYTYTGVSAILLRSKRVIASAGSYAYSGQIANFLKSRLITASAGAYVYAGQSAVLTHATLGAYTLTAQAGVYTISGQSAVLTKSKLLTASAGAYAYTGQSATLTYMQPGVYVLTALPGSYVYAGQSAVLSKSSLNTNSGGYSDFYDSFERHRRAHRQRLKELDDQEDAEQAIKDAKDAEIAHYLHEQERQEDRRDQLARLKDLALRYSAQDASSERVKAALIAAQQALTFSTLERLSREIERQLQEEEFVLLLLLSD